jgi:hypothetical protein
MVPILTPTKTTSDGGRQRVKLTGRDARNDARFAAPRSFGNKGIRYCRFLQRGQMSFLDRRRAVGGSQRH